MKHSPVTIRDLALKLNISISTVSRALRDAPDINPSTKQAVLDMARTLNYEPNRLARSLRINKTNTLGIIVPEIAMHFFSSAISGIQEFAQGHQYNTMICQSLESMNVEKQNVHMLVANRVDGLIISLSSQTDEFDHLASIIQKDIALVQFDRVTENVLTSSVVVDDHVGAYKAVDYLARTGCRKIGFIGGPRTLSISARREQGYRDALRDNDIPFEESLIVRCHDLHNDAEVCARAMLDKKPDAVFCMNDPLAITLITIARDRQVYIPEELSIVGFTNEPVSRYIEPALTTVSQPAYTLGQEAARLLFDQLATKEDFEPVKRVIETELIVRRTTRLI